MLDTLSIRSSISRLEAMAKLRLKSTRSLSLATSKPTASTQCYNKTINSITINHRHKNNNNTNNSKEKAVVNALQSKYMLHLAGYHQLTFLAVAIQTNTDPSISSSRIKDKILISNLQATRCPLPLARATTMGLPKAKATKCTQDSKINSRKNPMSRGYPLVVPKIKAITEIKATNSHNNTLGSSKTLARCTKISSSNSEETQGSKETKWTITSHLKSTTNRTRVLITDMTDNNNNLLARPTKISRLVNAWNRARIADQRLRKAQSSCTTHQADAVRLV
jgi:hypothetical protein